ncbi:hypothetical protein [Massilia horti]|uniref:PEP-CTERM protein-sorting domain-containing protein n=1 Tax=Massilia horti TaxID=2562153 RepID=A0A4Y9T616_9BURK|nr:hypothetical protein [Massilia horti]TFW32778.1 hypothetical protein E4O92_08875 [Massilia horti]
MKRKHLYAASLLLFSAAAARAEPSPWWFSYTGFYHEVTTDSGPPIPGEFDPQHQITGSFLGEDLNHDNMIDRSEISMLKINGLDYIACPPEPDDRTCRIDWFSYTLDGALDFSAYLATHNEPTSFYTYSTIATGDTQHDFWIVGRAGVWRNDYYRWTPETAFTIIQSPFPEPGQYAMLAAGLLAATTLRTRRQRKRQGSESN